jgi:hypothetical protein
MNACKVSALNLKINRTKKQNEMVEGKHVAPEFPEKDSKPSRNKFKNQPKITMTKTPK